VCHGVLSATDGSYYGMLKDTEGEEKADEIDDKFFVSEHCTQTKINQHQIGAVIADRNGHRYAAPTTGGSSSSPTDPRSGGSSSDGTAGRWVSVQIYTEHGYNAPDGSYHVEGTYSTVYVWIPDYEYTNMACLYSRHKLAPC
jgi:hypothetical protein